jgi:hypothetical protein
MKIFGALLLVSISFGVSLGDNNYTYYVHAQEWQGTACDKHDCTGNDTYANKDQWNIHGLWPSIPSSIVIPSFCTNEAFNWDSFSSSLQEELVENWSGLYSTEDSFLDHEWSKHGTCWDWTLGDFSEMPLVIQDILKSTSTSNDQSQFFQLVLTIHKHYNIYSVLQQKGIVPSNTTPYTSQDIAAALDTAFGLHTYILSCNSGTPSSVVSDERRTKGFLDFQLEGGLTSADKLVSQIELCLDLNYKAINCPTPTYNSCSGATRVWYPEFTV